jgi:bacteriorhodopsin
MNPGTDPSSQLTQIGSNAIWVGTISHAFSTIMFIVLSKKSNKHTILYYYINIIICAMATFCYILMGLRQCDYITADGNLVLWGRYLEFGIGTPLLLLDFGLTIGMNVTNIFYVCMLDILMIVSGWFSTIASTNPAKWILFIISSLFYAPIVETLFSSIHNPEETASSTLTSISNYLSMYTDFIWTGYPILWVLHDGFHLINLDTECIIHTILDIFAKDIFGFLLIYSHKKLDEAVVPFEPTDIMSIPTDIVHHPVPQLDTEVRPKKKINNLMLPQVEMSPVTIRIPPIRIDEPRREEQPKGVFHKINPFNYLW